MDLECVLLLKRLPHVTACDFSDDFREDADLTSIVAGAVTFARASCDVAQVLIQMQSHLADEFEKFVQVLLDGLQVDCESLKANLKKTQSELHFVLEITSRKES